MSDAACICSPDLWERGHGPTHPLRPERLQRTWELLSEYGAFDGPGSAVLEPRTATDSELRLFHTAEYVDAVARLSVGVSGMDPGPYNFGPGDNPVFPGMYETEALKAGASLTGVRAILDRSHSTAFNFSGGLHHARPGSASGFCVFNDAAIAIHALLRECERVAYVDIDVHHGDGVQNAFYDDPRVLTISLHQCGRTLFPGTGSVSELGEGEGRGYSVNVPLMPATGDDAWLWTFRSVVPPLLEQFRPRVLVSQLGVDTHFTDVLGGLRLTTRAQQDAVVELKSRADHSAGWLALGGGGYSLDAVPRAWTLAYGVMSTRTFPDELPPEYSRCYGRGTLHDASGPPVDETTEAQTWDFARRSVKSLRKETRGIWDL